MGFVPGVPFPLILLAFFLVFQMLVLFAVQFLLYGFTRTVGIGRREIGVGPRGSMEIFPFLYTISAVVNTISTFDSPCGTCWRRRTRDSV